MAMIVPMSMDLVKVTVPKHPQVEPSEVDILHSLYTYTLYIWRFDLGKI